MNRFIPIYIDEFKITKNNINEFVTQTIKNINKSYKVEDKNKNYKPSISIENEKIIINYISEEKNFNSIMEDKANLKKVVKYITRLSYLYESFSKFKFSLEDCNNSLKFDFENINFDKTHKDGFKTILNEKIKGLKKNSKEDKNSQEEKNFYFYDEKNQGQPNIAWKMIMSLIISEISNTAIFIQGFQGSGKSQAAKFYGSK